VQINRKFSIDMMSDSSDLITLTHEPLIVELQPLSVDCKYLPMLRMSMNTKFAFLFAWKVRELNQVQALLSQVKPKLKTH